MHPFNTQQTQQYIITNVGTNLQSLPASTSIRKIPASINSINPNTLLNSNLINSLVANNTNNNNSKSIANCVVPMLLTTNNNNNHNSIPIFTPANNIDQQQQQQQQHFLTKTSNTGGIPIMASPKQVVITNSNNITYQVITPATNANNLNTVLTPANGGTMSLLLTSSNAITNTAGHTTAGQIIIRNAAIPVKQQQQKQQRRQQHQHQQQQQQQTNADLIKQVVIGNANSNANITATTTAAAAAVIPRTTLLKPLIPIKPATATNPSGKTKIVKTATKLQMIPYHQQSTKLYLNHNMEVVNTMPAKKPDVNTLIAAIPSIIATPTAKSSKTPTTTPTKAMKPTISSTSTATTTTSTPTKLTLLPAKSPSKEAATSSPNNNSTQGNQQKLFQVSLLQNSKTFKNSLLKNAELKSNNNNSNNNNNNNMKPIIKINEDFNKKSSKANLNIEIIKADQQHPPTDNENGTKNLEIFLLKNGKAATTSSTTITTATTTSTTTAITTSTTTAITTASNQFENLEKQSSSIKMKTENCRNFHQRSLSLNSFDKTNSSNLKNFKQRRLSLPVVKSKDILTFKNSPNIFHKEKLLLVNSNNSEENFKKNNEEKIEKIMETVNEICADVDNNEENGNGNDEDNDDDDVDVVDVLVEEEYLENTCDEKIEYANGNMEEIHENRNESEKDLNQNCLKTSNDNSEQQQQQQQQQDHNISKENKSNTKTNDLTINNTREDVMMKDEKQIATNSDNDDDDDVTILPIEDVQIESIEIIDDDDDDDDDDNDNHNDESNGHNSVICNNNNNKRKNIYSSNEKLLCGEQIYTVCSPPPPTPTPPPPPPPPLTIANNSLLPYTNQMKNNVEIKLKTEPIELEEVAIPQPILQKTVKETKADDVEAVSYHSVVDILSHFNMLNWRQRIGSAKGTKMRFQLNEFNLVKLYEDCPPRNRTHTAYDKPLYERVCTPKDPDDANPLSYQCRRCNCHGPAIDFLAPEFCSLRCLKRDARKRMRDDKACILRKRTRKMETIIKTESVLLGGRKFRWSVYMKTCPNAIAAPISLFLNPFPTGPNNFAIGMKLEAIDPDNCSLFCVCTIVGISGYRLKLHFDGYESTYDFWVNADSMDIFPYGWCAKTGRILQPPKDIPANSFNWSTYLQNEQAITAPRHLFTHLNSSSSAPKNPFKIGMHLEAEDLNDTGKLCVATVADVLDDRIRIHFDGWDDCYDIIVDIHSPYIHPCGWHAGRQQLVVPPECENISFHWPDYIRKRNYGVAAGAELFSPREPINFRPNMKLEVVDPRNPSIIRPATVVAHKGHRVKLHLDCWPNDYCFWLEDDSPDLHPIGWCDATDHNLEPPPGHLITTSKIPPCPINGCRGIGNAKDPLMHNHTNRNCCPYAPENWRIIVDKPIRLNNDMIVRCKPKITPKWKVSPLTNNNRCNEQQFTVQSNMNRVIDTKEICSSTITTVLKQEKDNKDEDKNQTVLNKKPFIDMNSYSNLSDKLHINKEFLIDYGPRLQQNYTLWHKNFTIDGERIQRNPMEWTAKETSKFIKDMLKDDDRIASALIEEDIDGRALLLLQQDDITDRLGFKLGKAVKLHTIILQLRTIAVLKFKTPYSRNFIK